MKGEHMKFVFKETGEICHYRHTILEGVPAILVTRCKGLMNEESRYYEASTIEEGLQLGVIELLNLREEM
jgi:hypothetical protein